MNASASPSRIDRLVAAVADRLRDPTLLFLRVIWGWMFFQTGLGKLGNLANTTEFFASLGLPAPAVNAVAIGALELAGGLAMVGGLFGRPVALLLTGNMAVAYLTAHRDAFASLRAFTAADPCMFLVASLVVLAFGPGRWSLDALRLRAARSPDRAFATGGGAARA